MQEHAPTRHVGNIHIEVQVHLQKIELSWPLFPNSLSPSVRSPAFELFRLYSRSSARFSIPDYKADETPGHVG